jgi:hypothetical protein
MTSARGARRPLLGSIARVCSRGYAISYKTRHREVRCLGPPRANWSERWCRQRPWRPDVWVATKPVRDMLIGETVKRLLGP